jgi:CHASE1-domain containing sensor protein
MTFSGATNETIKGLSSQPMLLLVAALNVLMIGGLLYVARAQQEERQTLMRGLIDNCGNHK